MLPLPRAPFFAFAPPLLLGATVGKVDEALDFRAAVGSSSEKDSHTGSSLVTGQFPKMRS